MLHHSITTGPKHRIQQLLRHRLGHDVVVARLVCSGALVPARMHGGEDEPSIQADEWRLLVRVIVHDGAHVVRTLCKKDGTFCKEAECSVQLES